MKTFTLLLIAFALQGQERGHTTPDIQARFHSLCLITRGPMTVAGTCRIEDDPQPGYENHFHIAILSPWMRLDAPQRFEAAVTVAATPEGRLRVDIAHWGSVLMIPLDAQIREAERQASAVATKDGQGVETFRQGVTAVAVGEGEYLITIDHIGRGW